ncbi:MAG: TIM barrel protein [Verrucomicrobiota bacterium]|nr:sugar phosphate isomerase/epimerase [Limisphaera sp.]MDW8382240.1 TIM barrel protein [Verrucomicrobiota bacterium]
MTLGSLASVELLKGRILYGSLTASGSRYRIGVCDWMLLQRQTLRAISLAAELGAQGLEVDMGPLGQRETFQNALADPDFRASFLETARQHNITLCSLAMSAFYAQSFVERPSVPRMVEDALQTAMALGIRVLFLPLGVPCDLVARPELRPSVVARLREIAGAVEAARVVLGIETSLPAAEEIQLLDEVGSAAVRSYFNFAQAMKHRRNLITELETLGAQRLIQIHASNEDGLRLPEDPSLDLPRIKQTLDRMGWSGWLVVERSRDARKPRDLHHNYATNIGWLKQIFQRSSEAS